LTVDLTRVHTARVHRLQRWVCLRAARWEAKWPTMPGLGSGKWPHKTPFPDERGSGPEFDVIRPPFMKVCRIYCSDMRPRSAFSFQLCCQLRWAGCAFLYRVQTVIFSI
jgi:hypothetical protein